MSRLRDAMSIPGEYRTRNMEHGTDEGVFIS